MIDSKLALVFAEGQFNDRLYKLKRFFTLSYPA